MRLHFQESPWDLYATMAYAVPVASVVFAIGAGAPFALVLVVFIPGYLIAAALFPAKDDFDWIERLVVSSGLSIAVVPLLVLLLNFTSYGVGVRPAIAIIALFTAAIGAAAYWRRMRLPVDARLSGTVILTIPEWHRFSAFDKTLTVLLAVTTIAAVATVTFAATMSKPSQRFTEFYLLGPGGNASGYPILLNVSDPGTVILGIANHEAVGVSYTVRVDLVGIRIAYNATSHANETFEVNRSIINWMNITLVDGASWTGPYIFSISAAGLWKLQFLLFVDGNLTTVYRTLHIYITVA